MLQLHGYVAILLIQCMACLSLPFTRNNSVVSIDAVCMRRKLHTIDEGPPQADVGAAPAVLPLQGTASTCGRQEPAHLRKLLAARGRLLQAGICNVCMAYAAEAAPPSACCQSVLWRSVLCLTFPEPCLFRPLQRFWICCLQDMARSAALDDEAAASLHCCSVHEVGQHSRNFAIRSRSRRPHRTCGPNIGGLFAQCCSPRHHRMPM